MFSRFSILMVMLVVVLIPLVLINVMLVVLAKLNIAPILAPIIVFLMFFGTLINIPVIREPVYHTLPHHPLQVFGLGRYWPNLQQNLNQRIIAVNVGGFIIPMILVSYEVVQIAMHRPDLLLALGLAVLLNTLLCFLLARPIPKIGIALPVLIPGLFAAICAIALAPDMAPPVAFCAGVLGPVIGADLMNLKEIRKAQVGMASIGGAGTFDGIVISGLLAVLLA